MGLGVGRVRTKPVSSPSRVWIPLGRAGSQAFRASGKNVCRAEKVGAGRVGRTAKYVKEMQRQGREGASYIKEGKNRGNFPGRCGTH